MKSLIAAAFLACLLVSCGGGSDAADAYAAAKEIIIQQDDMDETYTSYEFPELGAVTMKDDTIQVYDTEDLNVQASATMALVTVNVPAVKKNGRERTHRGILLLTKQNGKWVEMEK